MSEQAAAPAKSKKPAGNWQAARQLYPLYQAVLKQAAPEVASCSELDAATDNPDAAALERAWQWFDSRDEQIQVHQLRHLLQTTPLGTEENLRALLARHLAKDSKSDSDRDKLDFLMVQYFAQCVPSGLDDNDVDLEYVAQVLEPILGPVAAATPDWLKPLQEILETVWKCQRLSEVLQQGLLERGRQIKMKAGARYFEVPAMLTFTRFNFLVRRAFFRLMHSDLDAIQDGLRELERRGVKELDLQRAQLSNQEAIRCVRQICRDWKNLFRAEYSVGQPLNRLMEIRAVVDETLGRGRQPSAGAQAPQKETGAAKNVPQPENSVEEFKLDQAPAPPAAPRPAAATSPTPVVQWGPVPGDE